MSQTSGSEEPKTEESENNSNNNESVPIQMEESQATVPLIQKEVKKSPSPVDSTVKIHLANSSLSLLAEYTSSDDSDDTSSEDESSETSSDADSDSSVMGDVPESDSSDSSTTSSSSDEEAIAKIRKKIDDLDDDEIEEESTSGPAKFKVPGELGIEDLPPIEDLHITVPEVECVLLGKISSIVDQLGKVTKFW